MALAPRFAGQALAPKSFKPTHTLELYLDYTCPFSAKMFLTFNRLRPSLASKYPNLVTIFRPQVQPWHPSSTLCHEAALAVSAITSEPGATASAAAFWTYSRLLFEHQKEYFDVNVVNETRNQTYRRLAQLAGQLGSEAEAPQGIEEKVYRMLEISDKPGDDGALNTGNQVTDALKVQIKAARLVGVHVSPTVIFDGVVRGEVSSSWDEAQWEEWLGENAG